MNVHLTSRSSSRVNLTPKQANIYVWGWQPEARFRYAVCGRRFGKTYLAIEELRRAVRLAVARKVNTDNEIWYGGVTLKQAKKNFWRKLKRGIPGSWIVAKNETDHTIELRSGHIIRLVGLENHDDLRGSGLWFFIGDEWADCKPEAWTETIRPMLATAGGHALFIGTPKGFNHFYEGYVAGQPAGEPDTRSWLYTTLDGGNVPLAEIEAARRNKDLRSFRQEYEASFETFSGRVYYAFDRRHTVRVCPIDPSLPIHIGMDFNVNPMSATVWQERGKELWQVDEVVIPTSNTDEMADEIERRYGKHQYGQASDLRHISIYPDPAGVQRRTSAQGRTDIGILQGRGFNVVAMSSHPLVRDRINIVNSKFQTADEVRHAFVDPRCVKSIEAYEKLTYKDGTSEPDKDSGHDHLPDATGYFMFAKFGSRPARKTFVSHFGR